MKIKDLTRLLKKMVETLASVTKAKFLAQSLKTRMSDIKTRVTIFSLLYLDKSSLLGSIRPNKLRAAFASPHRNLQQDLNGSEVQYQISNQADEILYQCINKLGDATVVEEGSYGFQHEDGEEDNNEEGILAMELVGDSKEKEEECFGLEDRIDEVAELFISRFHQQMRLQKQNSFK